MTKFWTRCLFATLLVGVTASMASATKWPPGTGGLYPDSMSIYNIQFGLTQQPGHPEYPSLQDTVYGVGGIVTGFDPIATGYAFYIQTSVPGSTPHVFSGIDVFTGSFNFKSSPFSVALGDSIIVNGGITEFGNGTEIQGLDGVQGTQDLSYRIISHNNPLPPFYIGTTTDLRELNTNTNAEQYEGMLVRVNGPIIVKRTSLTGGLGTNNSFLAVSASAPSDSIFVDGNTLTTYAPPSVGTSIDYVQGILDQRVRGYRIQLRDGNDILTHTPPNLVDAYPLTDNTIRVVYDRNVTSSSATNTSNYSLASFGSIDGAVMDGTSAAVVSITNGLSHGVLETITANNIEAAANLVAMTVGQSRTFVNGVLSCAEIQAPNPDSLAAAFPNCLDRSRFAGGGGQISQGNLGPRLSMTAVMSGVYTPLNYLADEPFAQRGGVSVFAPPIPLVDGHRYLVVGNVQEFFGETEVSGVTYQVDQGAAPSAAVTTILTHQASVDTCDSGNALLDGEDYEGMLVKLSYVKVFQRFVPAPVNGFHVRELTPTAGDTIFVMNLNGVLGVSDSLNPNYGQLGHVVDVTGMVHYTGNSFRVCPRRASDIVDHGLIAGVGQNPGKLSFAVYPNPSRRMSIAFTLPQAGPVDLSIYDVSGRLVASLARGHLPAGSYSRAWSGKDASGNQLNSGIYFARLKAGGEQRSIRTVLVAN